MKHYTFITKALYKTPWLILPSVHTVLSNHFQKYLRGELAFADSGDFEAADVAAAPVQPSNGVAVIPVNGVIGNHLSGLDQCLGGTDLQNLRAALKAARDDASITQVVLWFASPGGGVSGVSETAELISEVDKVKPVYAFVDDMACSAAYWLASQCRAIFATPSSEVGSVGCYIFLADASKAYEMEGVKPDPIVSKASPMKLAGADFKPLTDDERAMFQAEVDQVYKDFTAAILSKRTIAADYLNGQVFKGTQGIDNGMVDGLVNDLDDLCQMLAAPTTANTTTTK